MGSGIGSFSVLMGATASACPRIARGRVRRHQRRRLFGQFIFAPCCRR